MNDFAPTPWQTEPVCHLPIRKPITPEEWARWRLYLVQARQIMQRAGLRELGLGGLSAD